MWLSLNLLSWEDHHQSGCNIFCLVSYESWRCLLFHSIMPFNWKFPQWLFLKLHTWLYTVLNKIRFVLSYPQDTYPSMTPPRTQQMNWSMLLTCKCICNNRTSTFYLLGGMATCMQLPGKLSFHRVFYRFWPCEKCPVHRYWDFLPRDQKHCMHWRLL